MRDLPQEEGNVAVEALQALAYEGGPDCESLLIGRR